MCLGPVRLRFSSDIANLGTRRRFRAGSQKAYWDLADARASVARWCSGLARVENDPANDGLWTPAKEETHRREFESPPGYQTPRSNFPMKPLGKAETQTIGVLLAAF